jgi:hypothetical protein
MASGDPPSGLALLAEKAARAFEAGEYAEARRCVGDLELEARVGGNPMHARDAARVAQNVAVLDFCDTEREGRLDAAGFRDTLRRAESAFEAASSSDAEPADPEADARDSRILRANIAWATMRGAFSDAASTIAVLERVFDDTVATDDGSSSTDTLHETFHVASMLLRALAASGSRADAEKALRILSVAEAMTTRRENADDARLFVLRERARASMTLGDLATAREALRLIQTIQTTSQASSDPSDPSHAASSEELASLRARLAYLEGDGEAALRLFSTFTNDKTAPRDDARALNLASVLELSGSSATASFLLDSIRSRRRDDDDDADDRKTRKTQTDERDDDDDDDDDDVSRFKRAAAYRAGVLLLRAEKPAAAALLVLAGGAAAGAPETFVRLAECACGHAARGGEADDDERKAAAAFVAASDGVPLSFSGAQTYLDSALAELCRDDDDEARSRKRLRKPRLRAHAHAQRAYVCLALGKRLDALSSANEVLAIVDAAEINAKRRASGLGDAGKTREEDGFESDELEAYATLAKAYAAKALTSLGRHEEAATFSTG